MSHEVYLSLGSNLGDREANLHEAINLLQQRAGEVLRTSSFLETEPWGFQSPNRFLNAAVCLLTDLTPHQLLAVTQQIERDLGRTAKTRSRAYADRPIDIDILLYDDIQISTPELTIPHPLMHKRDFVMIPLKEVWAPYNPPAGDRGERLIVERKRKKENKRKKKREIIREKSGPTPQVSPPFTGGAGGGSLNPKLYESSSPRKRRS